MMKGTELLKLSHADLALHAIEGWNLANKRALQWKEAEDELRRVAAALAAIREEAKWRRWICEGRGSYAYDDDRYRKETAFAFDAIEKTAVDALAPSGKPAHETPTEKQFCHCGLEVTAASHICRPNWR